MEQRPMYFRAYDRTKKKVVEERFAIKGEVALFDILGMYTLEGIFTDLIIEQYTGLTDISEEQVEVCENDIVTWGDNPDSNKAGVIKYRNGSFYIDIENAPRLTLAGVFSSNIRVIGREE